VACDPIGRPGLPTLARLSELHRDVGEKSSKRHLLIRDHVNAAIAPGNVRWRAATYLSPRWAQ
jgi:hypothetical protein